ncbi:hypothetical protein Tco_0396559 [Tanacetum coccineum]
MFISLLVIKRFDSVGAFFKLSDRIGSAMTSCNSFFNQLALRTRYAISDGSGYAVFNCRPEQCLEVGWIQHIQVLDMAYWGFLGVGTTLDIFQNIILIPYLEYGVLILSGYGVLIFIPLWSLVSAGTDTPYLP